MKKLLAMALASLFLFSIGTLVAEDTGVYQGSKKCSMCHKRKHAEHYEAMSTHAHMTTAFGKLSEEEQKKAECVVCHTTGFGNGGYDIANPDEDLAMVGCESCHTDLTNEDNYNAHRKRNGDYTPVKPTAETCKTCHNEKSPTFKPMNFEEEMKKFK